MTLIAAIFRFEWYRLLRSRVLLYSIAAFTFIAGLAIHTGRRSVQARRVQLDSIQHAYQRDFQTQWQPVADTTEAGKKKAANAGLAVVVNHRLPQNALWMPQPLQMFSIGISDIQPFFYQVQKSVSYLDPPNIPVSNPVRLFAGNFDLAFVWIYILPLLIITFGYPLYAEEKEAGTAALLVVQGRSLRSIMACKLLFRTLLISVLVLLLNIAGYLAIPGNAGTSSGITGWCYGSQLYILFWTALVWLVAAFRGSSSLTALLLVGAWLLAVMMAPAVTNIYVAARHPLPLRSELASLQRHESEAIWSMDRRILIDSFNTANPQYNYTRNDAKDTLPGSARFVAAYYDLLERRVGKEAAAIDREVAQRNSYFRQAAVFNPVLQTQQLFNRLAGTSWDDYQAYHRQVAAFQQQWKVFLYPWLLTDKVMGPSEFRQFPVFRLEREPVTAADMLRANRVQIIITVLLLAAGYRLLSTNI